MGDADHPLDRRLAVGIGIVTLAGAGLPVLYAATLRDRLPDEVVRHWGAGGTPTGTWSLTTQLVVLGLFTLALVGTCGAVAVIGRSPVTVRRLLAGTGAWLAVFLGALQVDLLRVHLDVADPLVAPMPDAGLAAGAVLGLAAAVLVGRLAREAPHAVVAPAPAPADRPRLSGSPAAPSWRATAPPSPALAGAALVVIVLLGLLSLLAGWWLLVVAALLALLLAGMARFVVEVDERGLTVSAPMVTMLQVPLPQVADARVLDDVNPFWEFGGWGLRVTLQGRTGVVSRRGEALAVTRADGSEVVVTIDDAETAAATLNTLVDRRFDAR